MTPLRPLALLAALFAATACGDSSPTTGRPGGMATSSGDTKLVPVPLPLPFSLAVPVPRETGDQAQPLVNEGTVALPVGHYTIMARDEATGDLGVASVSCVPGAADMMFAARAGAGIVMVASRPDSEWRDRALAALAAGKTPQQIVDPLGSGGPDADRSLQVALLAADGRTADYTGRGVLGFNEHLSFVTREPGCVVSCCLVNPGFEVPRAMQTAFHERADLPLPERLLVALQAAWKVRRPDRDDGPNSQLAPNPAAAAALLVVRAGGGYDGKSDHLVDLRVDFSNDSVPRLVKTYEAYTRAVLRPRLREELRSMDSKSPLYESTSAWVRRLGRGAGVGDR